MAYQLNFEGKALDAYNAMVAERIATAMKEGNLARDDLTVRMLRPEDLGLSNPEFTFSITAAQWNTSQISTTVSNNRWIGINGIILEETATPSAGTQLKFKLAGRDARYWQIQGINTTQNSTLFFQDPLTVDANTNITMDIYGKTTDTDYRLVLLGVVVEKKGILTM